MPTLRQRLQEAPEELELLVRSLTTRMNGQDSADLWGMTVETLRRDVPADHQWPSNVRELEQAVRRILLTRRYAIDAPVSTATSEDELLQQLQEGSLDVRMF
ncbi:MAG: hypothetical protein R3F37_07565 [Candidatus Competibacteraceae bacterium]